MPMLATPHAYPHLNIGDGAQTLDAYIEWSSAIAPYSFILAGASHIQITVEARSAVSAVFTIDSNNYTMAPGDTLEIPSAASVELVCAVAGLAYICFSSVVL